MGKDRVVKALQNFDKLYPQPSGESALQQLQVQLANPLPYDLEDTNLAEYKDLDPRWQDWNNVRETCARLAVEIFDRVCDIENPNSTMRMMTLESRRNQSLR